MLRIQRLRIDRGWSRSELARRAQLNQVTVGLVESRRFAPYPVQLEKLAAALGVSEMQVETLMEEVEPDE